MAKAKKPISQVSKEVYDLLEPFTAEERARILNGVRVLFGDMPPGGGGGGGGGAGGGGGGGGEQDLARRGARAYFDHKDPQNKTEQFATAARFLEHTTNSTAVSKADFQRVISTEARRGFNQAKFARDVDNARAAGFFNPGGSAASGYTLSHVGQKYVDALPDRAAAKAVKKATKTTARRTRVRAKTA